MLFESFFSYLILREQVNEKIKKDQFCWADWLKALALLLELCLVGKYLHENF